MDKRFDKADIKMSEEGVRYFPNVIYPEIELDEDDIYILTQGEDRYDKLSLQFYGTVDYWWVIASANLNAMDSLHVKPGTEIRIPANPAKHVAAFEELNY